MQSGPSSSRRRKWLYAFLGVSLVIIALGLGSGMVWWQHNGASFGIEAEAAQRDGGAAGVRTDQQGCLQQASRRHSESTGAAALGITNSFLGTCLPAARPTPGFCAVPSSGAPEIRAWRTERCSAVPEDVREACGAIIGSVQQICRRLNPTGE